MNILFTTYDPCYASTSSFENTPLNFRRERWEKAYNEAARVQLNGKEIKPEFKNRLLNSIKNKSINKFLVESFYYLGTILETNHKKIGVYWKDYLSKRIDLKLEDNGNTSAKKIECVRTDYFEKALDKLFPYPNDNKLNLEYKNPDHFEAFERFLLNDATHFKGRYGQREWNENIQEEISLLLLHSMQTENGFNTIFYLYRNGCRHLGRELFDPLTTPGGKKLNILEMVVRLGTAEQLKKVLKYLPSNGNLNNRVLNQATTPVSSLLLHAMIRDGVLRVKLLIDAGMKVPREVSEIVEKTTNNLLIAKRPENISEIKPYLVRLPFMTIERSLLKSHLKIHESFLDKSVTQLYRELLEAKEILKHAEKLSEINLTKYILSDSIRNILGNLIEKKIINNYFDDIGSIGNIFSIVAGLGSIELLELTYSTLSEACPVSIDFQRQGLHGLPPIFHAVAGGSVECVSFFLNKGVQPNTYSNKYFYSLLDFTRSFDTPEHRTIAILLEKKSTETQLQNNTIPPSLPIKQKSNNKEKTTSETAPILTDHNKNPKKSISNPQLKKLFDTVKIGNLNDFYSYLTEVNNSKNPAGNEYDVNSLFCCESLLRVALQNRRWEIVKILTDMGADWTFTNSLPSAIEYIRSQIPVNFCWVRQLIERGVVDPKDYPELLLDACDPRVSHNDFNYLILKGADVNYEQNGIKLYMTLILKGEVRKLWLLCSALQKVEDAEGNSQIRKCQIKSTDLLILYDSIYHILPVDTRHDLIELENTHSPYDLFKQLNKTITKLCIFISDGKKALQSNQTKNIDYQNHEVILNDLKSIHRLIYDLKINQVNLEQNLLYFRELQIKAEILILEMRCLDHKINPRNSLYLNRSQQNFVLNALKSLLILLPRVDHSALLLLTTKTNETVSERNFHLDFQEYLKSIHLALNNNLSDTEENNYFENNVASSSHTMSREEDDCTEYEFIYDSD